MMITLSFVEYYTISCTVQNLGLYFFYEKYNYSFLSLCERIEIHDKQSKVLTLLTYKKYRIVVIYLSV